MRLEIVDTGYGGVGVARTPDGVVFIPGAFTGETVEAEILTRKKRFAQARLLEVIEPSPHRIAPEGAVVPGMVYAALDYPEEVALKNRQLATLLQRIGRFSDLPFLLPPVASPKADHYRNKLTLHWDGRKLGYIGDDNKTVIDTPYCPLSAPEINAKLQEVRANPRLKKLLKPGDRLFLRYTPTNGVLVGYGKPPEGELTESVVGMNLSVSANAFFQVNLACAELLLTRFIAEVNDAHRVFDLYCGCGLFGFAAVQGGAEELFGLETSQSAIASAQDNARRLGVKADYRCAPAESLPKKLPAADLWVVDPPRAGLSEEVRARILKDLPPRIAYISCGPDTLARDLATLAEAYTIQSVQLFDFFPRTAHFETLTFLKRK